MELITQSGVITVGLSWDFGPGLPAFDLDVSAVCFNATGGLADAAFFNQLQACGGSVVHSGDIKHSSQTQGLNEQITINLDAIPTVSAIVFLLSAYSGGNLSNCETALCQVTQDSAEITSITAAGPTTGSKTGLFLCMLYRHAETSLWHFKELLQPVAARHFAACLAPMRTFVDAILDPVMVGERILSFDRVFHMEKGDIVTIPKAVKVVTLGLGWTTLGGNLDLDASCMMLADVDNDGDLDPVDVVYFGAKVKPGVVSAGDNMSGDGEGDDETITVTFDEVPAKITTLAFCVNIYSLGRTFSEVFESYVRLVDPASGHEFLRYTLGSHLQKNGLIFCTVNRGKTASDPWTVVGIGEQCEGRRVADIVTPLWDGKWGGGGASGAVSASQPASSSSDEGCCIIA